MSNMQTAHDIAKAEYDKWIKAALKHQRAPGLRSDHQQADLERAKIAKSIMDKLAAVMVAVDDAAADLVRDAERFRALMRCGRIKMQGSAGVDPHTLERRNGSNVHFGAEFWPEPIPKGFEEHYEKSTLWGRACIMALADAIIEQEARADQDMGE